MATTYTTSTGIKKIGDGLEAGTWGTSTNENWERVSAMIGHARSLNIESMPNGSTSVTLPDGATAAVWVLVDSADSGGSADGDDGSEGRCGFADFVSTSTVTGDTTVEIRGSASGTAVNRIVIVKNSMTGTSDLIIDNGSATDYTIKPGCYAMLALKSAADGAVFVAGVHNILSKLQVEDIVLPGSTGSMEFVGTGTLTVKANSATALVVNDGTNDLVKVDTTTGTEVITLDAASGVTVDVSGGNTQPADLIVVDNSATALVIKDDAATFLNVDTSTAAEVVSIPTGDLTVTAGDVTATAGDVIITAGDLVLTADSDIVIADNSATALQIKDSGNTFLQVDTTTGTEVVTVTSGADLAVSSGDLIISSGDLTMTLASDINIRDNEAASLEIKDNGATFITVDTSTGADQIRMGVEMQAPDIMLTGTDGYINGTTLQGTTGYGFRNSSGTMQQKDSSGAWANILQTAITSAIVDITAASGVYGGLQGAVNIGPIRLVFDTIVLAAGGTSISLASDFNSVVYSVMVVQADASDAGDFTAYCLESPITSIGLHNNNAASRRCTYWAIGDSGN